jgi:hypothetical protein
MADSNRVVCPVDSVVSSSKPLTREITVVRARTLELLVDPSIMLLTEAVVLPLLVGVVSDPSLV